MKRKIFALFFAAFLTQYYVESQSSFINCDLLYYMTSSGGPIMSYNPVTGATLNTGINLPSNAMGLAVSNNLNSGSPSPTFYTCVNYIYWYYNGSTWVNTGHSTGGTNFVNPGGSGPYIYNINGLAGTVSRYDGTGNAVVIMTIPGGFDGPYDIIGDSQGNFYLIMMSGGQKKFNAYSPNASLVCSYSTTGLNTLSAGGGYAVINGVLYADSNGSRFKGNFSGTSINFQPFSQLPSSTSDMGSCAFPPFNTEITASSSTINTCTGGNVTLTTTSDLTSPTYLWSGPGIVSGQGTSSIVVNQPGTYTVVVTSSVSGCVNTSTVSYTLNGNASVTAVLSGNQDICVGNSTTFTSSTAGGTWSIDNSSIASIDASGNIIGISQGTTIVTYTIPGTGGCLDVTATRNVNVYPIADAGTITGSSTICVGNTTSLTTSGSGGTWNSSNTGVATVNSSGLVTAISTGNITITYTVAGSGPCPSASTTFDISVGNSTDAGVISGTQNICVGASTVFSSTISGGTWSIDNPTIASIDASGNITGLSQGTATITYSFNFRKFISNC
jgi:hypothetical protein